MAVGKQNPQRQKMINMMYLVLTALLALNVSAEVLNAFQNITDGINDTKQVVEEKTVGLMESFKKKTQDDPEAVPLYQKALKVQDITASLETTIDSLKKVMIVESGQPYEEGENAYLVTRDIVGKKNTDIPTRIMVEKSPKQPKPGGIVLKDQIQNARSKLINLFTDDKGKIDDDKFPQLTMDQLTSKMTFDAQKPEDDPQKRSWEQFTFGGLPLVAVIAVLTKMENDIAGTEAELISTLAGNIGATDLRVKKAIPVVNAPSSSVAVGETYEAEIFLGAQFATGKEPPTIKVNGRKLNVDATGTAVYTEKASSPGEKTRKTTITFTNPKTGEEVEYEKTFSYQAFEAPATISADAMNVFYVGLDNPVSVSVPGYRPNQLSVSCSGGNIISKGGSQYIVKPNKNARTATINVSAKSEGGGAKQMGSKKFRVKSVPKPTPYLGAKAGGEITKAELKLVNGLSIRLEGFAFEGLRYQATEYEFIYQPRAGDPRILQERGQRFSRDIQSIISGVRPGDRIIISNIKARGVGDKAGGIGEVNLPSGIVLTVK